MKQLKMVYRPPGELNPYTNNPRKWSPEEWAKLEADIEEFGFVQPILITGDDIVDGHARHRLALKRNEEIPTIDVSHLTPDQIRALRLVINDSATWATNDMEKRLQELSAIEMDMSRFGIDMEELAGLLDFTEVNRELTFEAEEIFVIKLSYNEEEYTEIKARLEALETPPEKLFLEAVMQHVPIQMDVE